MGGKVKSVTGRAHSMIKHERKITIQELHYMIGIQKYTSLTQHHNIWVFKQQGN